MKIDEILYALANIRQRMMSVDNAFGAAGTQKRMLFIDCMRDYALKEDSVGFTNYCQKHLAGGDAMSVLLDEMFKELGQASDEGTWDNFANNYL